MKEPLLQLSYQRLFNLWVCLLCGSLSLVAQDSIQVLVYGENQVPLPGVTIQGATYQNVTDELGTAKIPRSPSDQLEFSYLGYKTIMLSTQSLLELNGKVPMIIESNILSEVIVVGRTDAYQQEITQQVDMISAEEILQSGAQTSADAMAQNAQVFIQKSQMGGGSPIIRGFEANKVLLVVDGVRMNNAIYRSGHLQSAITVSSFMLEQLEVIYGPGSLMYGSDALGGVVHFRTKTPQLSADKNLQVRSTLGARYASANNEKTVHAHIELGGQKIGSSTSFSYSDFGDLRAGSKRKKYPDFGKLFDYVQRTAGIDRILTNKDPNIQIGTSYKQWDLMQKFILKTSKTTQYVANLQWSNSSDIPRYDQLAERSSDGIPSFSEWYYGPQQRKLFSLKGQYGQATKFYDRAQWLVAFQDIDEDRHSRNFQESMRENRLEDLQAWNVNLDFNKQLSAKLKINLEYGAEYILNKLTSNAFLGDITNGNIVQELSTRYPNSKNTWQAEGLYAILRKYNQKENLAIHAGVRLSAAQLFVSYKPGDGFTWPDFFYEGIKSNNAQGTTSVGLKYKNNRGLQLNLLGSTAFRAPNIDDFAKIRVKGEDATVPNVDLKPEKSVNAEFSIQQHIENKSDGGLTLSSTFFITRLKEAIVRKDYTLPNGANTIQINNRTFNAQANVNAEQAILYGISGQFEYIFNKYSLQGGINYIKGRSDDNGEETPLAHIPPLYGNVVFNYISTSWNFRTGYYFNGAKPLSDFAPGSSDNEEYATPEGSLSWGVVNTSLQYALTQNLSMTIGVDNLLDIHYRPFSSGVSAPGRNFRISVLAEF